MKFHNDTIVSLITPQGSGAIAVIRVSGKDSLDIVEKIFPSKKLSTLKSHTAHFGAIVIENEWIDEAVVTIFKSPHSYTKDDTVEISCHGSPFIVQRIIQSCIKNGARQALAGEFTQRAFLAGRFDLSQAEAVADLISSQNIHQHQLAASQIRGGFKNELMHLRSQLIHFVSMIELELDFAEEDVEFASRKELIQLILAVQKHTDQLIQSFHAGNVIKNGIQTVLVGRPNAGKSTLLNALLNEERAIVSEIAGTTRDTIEEILMLDGMAFRIIDTAGIRDAEDKIEKLGIHRTYQKIDEAAILMYIYDASTTPQNQVDEDIRVLKKQNVEQIIVGNKIDLLEGEIPYIDFVDTLFISAQNPDHVAQLKNLLMQIGKKLTSSEGTIVSNVRHWEALIQCQDALTKARQGIENQQSGEWIALDLREAIAHLGSITGEIHNEDILGNIFSKFCIGK